MSSSIPGESKSSEHAKKAYHVKEVDFDDSGTITALDLTLPTGKFRLQRAAKLAYQWGALTNEVLHMVDSANALAGLNPEAVGRVAEVLREIAKGEGRFDRDPLIHAGNCIKDMQALANDALAAMEVSL